MPQNKKASLRYKFLDEILSDRHHFYNMVEITEIVNEKLRYIGEKEVSKRTLEMDLVSLQEEPFNAEIERKNKNGKKVIFYKTRRFSIYKKELSDTEYAFIQELLETVAKFKGLQEFSWAEEMQGNIARKKYDKLIYFEDTGTTKNTNLLPSLFEVLSNKQVVEMHYMNFRDGKEQVYEYHPYALKQYDNRWYLVGFRPIDKILHTLPLERIVDFRPMPEVKFIPYEGDINDHFKDTVGITVHEDSHPMDIVFWVSYHDQKFVQTKPIHHSQELIPHDSEEYILLRNQYEDLAQNGEFFKLRCKHNYELERELISYFGEVVVIAPFELRMSLETKICQMHENYLRLRR